MPAIVVIDRSNFRKVCKDNGVTANDLLFNRITWRLAKIEQLEDVGMASCDAAVGLQQELEQLFTKLAAKLYGEANV